MMCIIIPGKMTIKGQEVATMFFKNAYVHFEIPRIIILDVDTRFLIASWTTLWEKMNTKLKRYLALYVFHSWEKHLGVGNESITKDKEHFVASIQAIVSKEIPEWVSFSL